MHSYKNVWFLFQWTQKAPTFCVIHTHLFLISYIKHFNNYTYTIRLGYELLIIILLLFLLLTRVSKILRVSCIILIVHQLWSNKTMFVSLLPWNGWFGYIYSERHSNWIIKMICFRITDLVSVKYMQEFFVIAIHHFIVLKMIEEKILSLLCFT